MNRLSVHYAQDSPRKHKSTDKEETKFEINDSDLDNFPYESHSFPKKFGTNTLKNNSINENELVIDEDMFYKPSYQLRDLELNRLPKTTKNDDRKSILEMLKGQQAAESELKSSSRLMPS